MYLIGDDEDIMTETYLAHALQFVACPYSACGVVRVAKQEDACLGVGACLLEGIPIDGESGGGG